MGLYKAISAAPYLTSMKLVAIFEESQQHRYQLRRTKGGQPLHHRGQNRTAQQPHAICP